MMHKDVILEFIRIQALILAPICPHWSEHVYNLLGIGSCQLALWPTFTQPTDPTIELSTSYLREITSRIRAADDAQARKRAKKGKEEEIISDNRTITLFVAKFYPEWQEKTITILKNAFNSELGVFDGSENQLLAKSGLLKDKKVMPFVAGMKVRYTHSS